ncbi:MAG: acyltransferase [Prevotella sp.]|nr:acyltransferase [Prevotella sp.]
MRERYVDVAKGIAMLFVVRIHTEIFGDLHFPYPVIAVPLFFFLSGFYDKTERPIKQWIKKDFCILVGTSFIWSVINFLWVSFLHILRTKSIADIELPISWDAPIVGGGVSWFLLALFWTKVFAHFFSKIRINDTLKILLLVIIGTVITQYNLPLKIDEGVSALVFYYIGKMVHPSMEKILSYNSLIIGGGICLMLMSCCWFPYELVNLSVSHPMYLYPVYLAMSFLSFITVMWICKKIENWAWLSKYGQQTLGILVLHPIMLHTIAVVLKRVFEPMSEIYIVCFLIGYVAVCVGAYYISLYISRHLPFLFGRFKSI